MALSPYESNRPLIDSFKALTPGDQTDYFLMTQEVERQLTLLIPVLGTNREQINSFLNEARAYLSPDQFKAFIEAAAIVEIKLKGGDFLHNVSLAQVGLATILADLDETLLDKVIDQIQRSDATLLRDLDLPEQVKSIWQVLIHYMATARSEAKIRSTISVSTPTESDIEFQKYVVHTFLNFSFKSALLLYAEKKKIPIDRVSEDETHFLSKFDSLIDIRKRGFQSNFQTLYSKMRSTGEHPHTFIYEVAKNKIISDTTSGMSLKKMTENLGGGSINLINSTYVFKDESASSSLLSVAHDETNEGSWIVEYDNLDALEMDWEMIKTGMKHGLYQVKIIMSADNKPLVIITNSDKNNTKEISFMLQWANAFLTNSRKILGYQDYEATKGKYYGGEHAHYKYMADMFLEQEKLVHAHPIVTPGPPAVESPTKHTTRKGIFARVKRVFRSVTYEQEQGSPEATKTIDHLHSELSNISRQIEELKQEREMYTLSAKAKEKHLLKAEPEQHEKLQAELEQYRAKILPLIEDLNVNIKMKIKYKQAIEKSLEKYEKEDFSVRSVKKS